MQSADSAGASPRDWAAVFALAAVPLLLICRLWLAADLPLTDTTEARYAEMARKMVETGNWLMPLHSYGVPYFAKPPFAFWMSAIGIKLLGVNELAVRVPILAWSVAFCAAFYAWLRGLLGRSAAITGVLILSSTLLFFVSTAAVMTDLILTACVGLALIAFWRRYHGGGVAAEISLYVAIGVGVLTKGPLAGVLVLTPIALWALATRQVGDVWQRLAWIRGGLLASAVALPWFAVAEWRYPGFLEYFIVGEHFGRFLTPGWSGDMYGYAHELPRGSIWIFFLIALLPWPLLWLPMIVRGRRRLSEAWRSQRQLALFGLFWALVPLGLFTASANIIWPYALPALPGTVLVITALLATDRNQVRYLQSFGVAAALAVAVTALLVDQDTAFIAPHTKKSLIETLRAEHPGDTRPIYYWGKQYFSAEFYSRGRATPLTDVADLSDVLARDQEFSLIVPAKGVGNLPSELRAQLRVVSEAADVAVLEPAPSVATGGIANAAAQVAHAAPAR